MLLDVFSMLRKSFLLHTRTKLQMKISDGKGRATTTQTSEDHTQVKRPRSQMSLQRLRLEPRAPAKPTPKSNPRAHRIQNVLKACKLNVYVIRLVGSNHDVFFFYNWINISYAVANVIY